MSTRSIIVLFSENSATRIYKHHDGYPSDTLNRISEAVDASKNNKDNFISLFCVDGPRVEWEGKRTDSIKDIYDCQGDLEWIYSVDLVQRSIKIRGGGYQNIPAYEIAIQKTVNPFVEVDCYIESAKAESFKEIMKATTALAGLGYSINAA